MTKRLIGTSKWMASMVAVVFASVSSFAAEQPPNIIFILTDDQRDDSFAAMGHDWVKTPHVDALLERSTRFTNAYIAEPTCNPSRASLLLGCRERVHRLGFSSQHRMTKSQWNDSYPALLKDAGYRTGYVGKWHVNTDGFPFEVLFDYCEAHHGHGPFFFETIDAEGKQQTMTSNRHHTDNAFRFLDTIQDGQPFCLSICYATPHGSKVRKMHTRVDESASLNPKLKDHPIYGGQYRDLDIAYPLQSPQNPYDWIPRHVMDQDKGRNKTYAFDYDPVSNKEHLYRYYQMITEIDQMVGELVEELRQRQLAQSTVLIFGSDHGLLLGEYGMGGKGLIFDLTAKFPCFIHDPKASEDARGQERSELVSSVDITATILDYAGINPSPFMSGSSLKPLVQSSEPSETWRRGLFLENLYTGRDTPIQEGFVENGWKYIRCYKADHPYSESQLLHTGKEPVWEMLFNLREDPGESTNVLDAPDTASVADQLRKKCEEEVARLSQVRSDYFAEYLAGPSKTSRSRQ